MFPQETHLAEHEYMNIEPLSLPVNVLVSALVIKITRYTILGSKTQFQNPLANSRNKLFPNSQC